ncbi:hypothetical protein BO80DRAFT_364310, partial [Aspergillus ibericus CBS 121593]
LVHTTTGCGEQGFPSAQPYLSHTPGANPFCCMFLISNILLSLSTPHRPFRLLLPHSPVQPWFMPSPVVGLPSFRLSRNDPQNMGLYYSNECPCN